MEVVAGILLCSGTLLIVTASIGVLRMPDLYMRMHAATKAGTVGVAMLLFAVACAIPSLGVLSKVIGTIFFILLTAPIGAHLLGKAMRETGYKMWKNKPDNEH